MRVRCAVFDFDGTLFDSMSIWDTAGELYLRSQGKAASPSLREDIRTMSLRQSAAYMRGKYGLRVSEDEIIEGINRTVNDFYVREVLPKPGVPEFLERMKGSGARLCIATATDRPQIEAALRRCSLDGLFDAVFTCGEVGHGKDEPYIFRAAVERFDADRDTALVFEDALHAARTASSDGFRVAAVYDPSEKRQDELRALSDLYITDFRRTEGFWKALPAI